jgi:hypothetical protein
MLTARAAVTRRSASGRRSWITRAAAKRISRLGPNALSRAGSVIQTKTANPASAGNPSRSSIGRGKRDGIRGRGRPTALSRRWPGGQPPSLAGRCADRVMLSTCRGTAEIRSDSCNCSQWSTPPSTSPPRLPPTTSPGPAVPESCIPPSPFPSHEALSGSAAGPRDNWRAVRPHIRPGPSTSPANPATTGTMPNRNVGR